VRKESKVQRTGPLVDEVEEDRDKRQNDENRRQDGQSADEIVRGISPGRIHTHGPGLKVHGWPVAERLSAHVKSPVPEHCA